MSKKSLMLLLIVGLPLVVILVLVAVLFMAMDQTPRRPVTSTSSSSTESSSESSISAGPGALINYKFAGITNNDTLVLFDDDKEQVVVQFDQRNWESIQWQPERKVFAVLGQAEPSSPSSPYNLYLFDPVTSQTTQVTSYNAETGGISGFAWLNNTTIAYTQGNEEGVWLHHYDYVNKQITKVIQVDAKIVYAGNAGYIFLTNNGIRWYDAEPKLAREITHAYFGERGRILTQVMGERQPILFTENSQAFGIYVVNSIAPEPATLLTQLNSSVTSGVGICQLGSQTFVITAQEKTFHVINIAQPDRASAQLVTNQDDTRLFTVAECAKSEIYIYAGSGPANQWYRFRNGALEHLPEWINLNAIAAL